MNTNRKYTIEGKEVSKAEFLKGIKQGKGGADSPREAAHTPTPWIIKENQFGSLRIETTPQEPFGDVVCDVIFTTDDRMKANAEFIVRAVNSHEALLEACKGLVRSVSMNCQEHGPLPGAVKVNIQKAIEAIAKAEGKSV